MKHPTHSKISVVFFDAHRVARSFLVSKNWFINLGILLSLIVTVALVSTGLSIRFYQKYKKSSPEQVKELELEIEKLQSQIKVVPEVTSQGQTDAEKEAVEKNNSPTPDTGVTLPTQTESVLPVYSNLFDGLPKDYAKSPTTKDPTIDISDFKPTWNKEEKSLSIEFNLKYIKADGGSQQGRILILARGKNALLIYPRGTFEYAGKQNLLNPQNGEFFSVSRFRETKANFPSVSNKSEIEQIEIIIFNNKQEMMIHKVFNL